MTRPSSKQSSKQPSKPKRQAPKKRSTGASSASMSLRGYLDDSRDLFTSLILVIPLFIVYQLGLLMTGGIRNGVDFITDLIWMAAGDQMLVYVLVNLAVLLAFGVGLIVLRKKGTFKPQIWPWVVGESTIYALLFGTVVIQLMSALGLGALLQVGGAEAAEYGVFTSIILSLGAGVYEETVFRLIGMGGLFWMGVRLFKLPTWLAAVGAVLLSSLIFSAIHYVGPLGDVFALGSFLYRFFAGIVLAVIFYLRGFAVAVYTHAIYDIIVMVFH